MNIVWKLETNTLDEFLKQFCASHIINPNGTCRNILQTMFSIAVMI